MKSLGASAFRNSYQHQPVVMGRRGAVASASTQSAAVGMRILQEGGNAVDAAVAMAAVDNVTLPLLCGLGGEAFCIVSAPDGRVRAFNGSGAAPSGSDAADFRNRGLKNMPLRGAESVAVPGNVHFYVTLLQEFGSLPLSRLLQPAIGLAENGFPVGQKTAGHLADQAGKLATFPPSAAVFLAGGRPPRAGELFVQPDLAASLRLVAEGGLEPFYRGEIGQKIIRSLAEGGSRYQARDFAGHSTDVYEPIRTHYRGYDILETAPPSQGLIVLEELNLLAGWDLAELGPLSARAIHLQVEAKRLAYADRIAYVGDPRFVQAPVAELISARYADRRRKSIDPTRAAAGAVDAGQPYDLAGATTSFVVVDGQGMAVSFIHSLSAIGGSGLVAEGTGILLNNRVGRGFSLVPGHPNELAGGKRTMHTLNCYQIHRDGRPVFVGGTPGGDGQPQWNMQVICSLIDFGMNVQQAAEWPRWVHLPGTDPSTLEEPWRLEIDGRFGDQVASELSAMGHTVHILDDWEPGRETSGAQLIRIDPSSGVLEAGSDPRAGGQAQAF